MKLLNVGILTLSTALGCAHPGIDLQEPKLEAQPTAEISLGVQKAVSNTQAPDSISQEVQKPKAIPKDPISKKTDILDSDEEEDELPTAQQLTRIQKGAHKGAALIFDRMTCENGIKSAREGICPKAPKEVIAACHNIVGFNKRNPGIDPQATRDKNREIRTQTDFIEKSCK